jgi:hypothetical protein
MIGDPGSGLQRNEAPLAPEAGTGLVDKAKRILFGAPRNLADRGIFRHLSLIPILAWIGLGADGLSSSSYGPDEAFRTLFPPGGQPHTYLAVGLAVMTATTVVIIAVAYSRVIEEFPQGGGGYVVATKLLGERLGVVSGCALLIDYMLTIAVSIAAAGDALFSFLPLPWHFGKLPCEILAILFLATLNIRGVRESVLVLAPIFFLFAATHLVLIFGGILGHIPEVPATASAVYGDFRSGLSTLGVGGMLLLLLHAYSMGSGTYTGIEAVSNGLPIMREPRVRTGRRTMLYMAASLAFTAGGLLVCYLLWKVTPVGGKTMNAVLLEQVTRGLPLGHSFTIITLISEGALLIVGAQAGFIDGPRVLANMAVDSWVPRRLAALSERLTTRNGIVLMGGSALLLLLYTRGDVRHLVVMYSINVFLTFSMTESAMCYLYLGRRKESANWRKKIWIHVIGLAMCLTILTVTVFEKFLEGGWFTLLATGGAIALCFLIQRHYRAVFRKLAQLYAELEKVPHPAPGPPPREPDPMETTAALLVGGYSGLGIHSLLNIFRMFPGYFKNVVFLSVGVVDSGGFKGERSIEALRESTENSLNRYVHLARTLGVPAAYRLAIGTDAVDAAEALCREVAADFPRITFFGGKLIFQHESWFHRLLHNETAFAIQRRLQWLGMAMVILPARAQ